MEYIAFDAHKHYTWARVERADGTVIRERRIPHERGALRQFLQPCEPGAPVAVETVGNWYWIVDEIEAAHAVPRLTHAHKAKLMLGMVNKTDRLDARGLNRLQRTGTLPTVWIPLQDLRDERELPRTRMALVAQRTQLKNRVHATLAKYALTITEVSDLYGRRGRTLLRQRIGTLPSHTAFVTEQLLDQIDALDQQIRTFERRMGEVFEATDEIQRVMTLPGVGFILAVVISTEVGDSARFPTARHLASYAGTTPRVHASGGKTYLGPVREDVNRYLKWAFVEAANAICRVRHRHPRRHVSRLYERIAKRRGHCEAIGAVARHLAEATYWMLKEHEPYREPGSSTGA